MTDNLDLSVLYVYYNTPHELNSSLQSLLDQIKEFTYEVIIVNNLSPQRLPKLKGKIKKRLIINNKENLGYGRAINQAAEKAKGEYLLILNPDVEFKENTVNFLLGKIKSDPKIGIIGPQFLDKDNKIIPTSSKVITLFDALIVFSFLSKLLPNNPVYKRYFLIDFDRKHEKEVPTLSGACLLLKKDIFNEVGGFDSRFFMYFEEIDLCYRIMKKGYKVVFYPSAQVIHTFGTSTQNKKRIQTWFEESRYKFLAKYNGKLSAFFVEFFLRCVNLSPNILKY